VSVLELTRAGPERRRTAQESAASAPFWFEAEPVAVVVEPEPAAVVVEAEPAAVVVEPEPVAVVMEAEPVVVVVEPEPVAVVVEPEPAPLWVEPELAADPRREPEADEPGERLDAVDPSPAIEQPPAPAWGWHETWGFELPARPSRVTGRQRRRRATVSVRGRAQARLRSVDKRYPILAVALVSLLAGALVGLPSSPSASARASDPGLVIVPRPSVYARRSIPPRYLALYWRAAQEYGLDWTKLAAIGQIESDHGLSRLPGVTSGTNASGVAGPAQFRASTWARYGVDVDGRGHIDQYDPADAITGMAAYLKAAGAPEHWRVALYTYNHSSEYVDQVMTLSRRFVAAR
jgi:hypothetical protein